MVFERAQRCLHVALIDTNVAECTAPYAFEAGWICLNFAVRNMPSLPAHLRDSLVMAIFLQLLGENVLGWAISWRSSRGLVIDNTHLHKQISPVQRLA